jgi:hypothetical protein
MNAKQKLESPAFIIAVSILILNDWYLKSNYANGLTGKLSDFAGLFALPFFLSALFPGKKAWIYVFTIPLFIIWKSPIVQPLINAFNNLGIPVHRTVDYSDCVALIILPFSFYVFNRAKVYRAKPLVLNSIAIFSLFAFTATSMPPGKYTSFVEIDKTYTFNCSRRELISRLNMVQLEYLDDLNKYGGQVDFDSNTNVFHDTGKKDTLAMILDDEKVKDTDTIHLRTSYAHVNISGNSTHSELKLLSLYCFVPRSQKDDYKNKAIRFFEKDVIKKITNYKHPLYR